jgi:hypothetical protein
LLGRAQHDRLPWHAKHHRSRFILGDGLSACTPNGQEACGAILAHSCEEAACTVSTKFLREGFEENID